MPALGRVVSLLTFALLVATGCSERNPLYNNNDGQVLSDTGPMADGGGPIPDGGGVLDLRRQDAGSQDWGVPPDATTGCTSNAQCGPSMYCDFNQGCAGAGNCLPRPSACPEIYAPVCGCDNKTYDNTCYAASAGVTVAKAGACQPAKTCDQLNQDYVAAVQQARTCAPMLPVVQCQLLVDNALHCACPIYVEQGNTTALAQMAKAKQQFFAQGCVPYQCGMPCPASQPGNCTFVQGKGLCK